MTIKGAILENTVKNFTKTLIGRPNTVKTQKSLFRNWIEPHLPKSDEKLNNEFIHSMATRWLEADLKPGTIKLLISLLRRYIEWKTGRSYNCGRLTHKICNLNQLEPAKAWTKDQCSKALNVAKSVDPELYKLMIVTLHTGMRKGEVFGLRWKDVDLMSGKIKISHSYDGPTKSGKPRTVPMSAVVEKILSNDYTIGSEDEHCFRRFDPNLRLEALCRLAKVPVISWHGLRHTFATLALESGVSPRLVASTLGHTRLSTTLDLYWNLTGEEINLEFLP